MVKGGKPNKRKRTKHGLLSRMKTKKGSQVINRRRKKGRHSLAPSVERRFKKSK